MKVVSSARCTGAFIAATLAGASPLFAQAGANDTRGIEARIQDRYANATPAASGDIIVVNFKPRSNYEVQEARARLILDPQKFPGLIVNAPDASNTQVRASLSYHSDKGFNFAEIRGCDGRLVRAFVQKDVSGKGWQKAEPKRYKKLVGELKDSDDEIASLLAGQPTCFAGLLSRRSAPDIAPELVEASSKRIRLLSLAGGLPGLLLAPKKKKSEVRMPVRPNFTAPDLLKMAAMGDQAFAKHLAYYAKQMNYEVRTNYTGPDLRFNAPTTGSGRVQLRSGTASIYNYANYALLNEISSNRGKFLTQDPNFFSPRRASIRSKKFWKEMRKGGAAARHLVNDPDLVEWSVAMGLFDAKALWSADVYAQLSPAAIERIERLGGIEKYNVPRMQLALKNNNLKLLNEGFSQGFEPVGQTVDGKYDLVVQAARAANWKALEVMGNYTDLNKPRAIPLAHIFGPSVETLNGGTRYRGYPYKNMSEEDSLAALKQLEALGVDIRARNASGRTVFEDYAFRLEQNEIMLANEAAAEREKERRRVAARQQEQAEARARQEKREREQARRLAERRRKRANGGWFGNFLRGANAAVSQFNYEQQQQRNAQFERNRRTYPSSSSSSSSSASSSSSRSSSGRSSASSRRSGARSSSTRSASFGSSFGSQGSTATRGSAQGSYSLSGYVVCSRFESRYGNPAVYISHVETHSGATAPVSELFGAGSKLSSRSPGVKPLIERFVAETRNIARNYASEAQKRYWRETGADISCAHNVSTPLGAGVNELKAAIADGSVAELTRELAEQSRQRKLDLELETRRRDKSVPNAEYVREVYTVGSSWTG